MTKRLSGGLKSLAALALFAGVGALLPACAGERTEPDASPATAPAAETPPNIVLVMFEDMSSRIGAFGDPVANTPVLDAFAEESVRFPNTFTTAGICAPSRSALITGVHQQALGTMHMRTRGPTGLSGGGPIEYDAVPPPEVKAFPEYLRALGYHTSNNGKTDYQFGEPFTVWDHNSQDDPQWWSGRGEDQPFFAMINVYETHESFLWPPEREPRNPIEGFVQARNAQTFAGRVRTIDPASVEVPPFLPDTPVVREDIALQYDNITFAEAQLSEIMERLEAEGLMDDTVVIVTTDHGDGLPRAKRSLYDSGLKVPLMVRFPDGRGAGTQVDDLISFLDLAPTVIRMAGGTARDHFQGEDFAQTELGTRRDYVFATLDRVDRFPERQKSVRDDRFKYIRNYRPDLPYFRPVAFRDSLPTMGEMWRLREAGGLTEAQARYFEAPRPRDELYDTQADPHEVTNLANDPAYADTLDRLSAALDGWIAEVGDLSELEERDMIEAMWPGGVQPVTQAPAFQRLADGRIELSSATVGASLGYRMSEDDNWSLYVRPIPLDERQTLQAKAIRYGYAESPIVRDER
ncbi:MAG: sulfatase [Pseudomonadota bacterium]